MKDLRDFLGWSAVLFGPVVVVLVLAAHPTTCDYAGVALLVLAALLLAAAVVRRDSLFAVPLVLLLMQGISLPKMSMLFQLARMHDALGPLTELRVELDAFEKKQGRPPKELSELGPVPAVEIWARDAAGHAHYHGPSSSVQTLALSPTDDSDAQPAGLQDAGGYAYDPASGRLVLACTGLDPKLGRPFYRK